MKKTLFLLFYLFIGTSLISQNITLQYSGTLKDLFFKLQNQYDYFFMYSNNEINDMQKVTVNVKDATIENILQELNKNIPIIFRINNKGIIIRKSQNVTKPVTPVAQPVKTQSKPVVKNNVQPAKPTVYQNKTEEKDDNSQITENVKPTDVVAPVSKSDDITEENKLAEQSVNAKPDNTNQQQAPEANEEANTAEAPVTETEKETDQVTASELQTAKPEKTTRKTNKAGEKNIFLHTNLLYDLILIPNIGAEYKINGNIGLALNALWTHINWDNGNKSYRLWGIHPEFRYYINQTSIYVGGMCQFGKLNFKFSTTGKQGSYVGVGPVFGYQLTAGERSKFDFGIGAGYAWFDYDSYQYVEGQNVRTDSDTKHLFIPIKAAVTFTYQLK